MDHWYVLFTKPRKEAQVSDQLRTKGVTVYLPMLPASPRRRRSPRPLFPRYLFARIDMSRMSSDDISWIPGLCYLVSFGGEYATVPTAFIKHIQQRLAERQQRKTVFHAGQAVQLPADHPLAELDAVFERPVSDGARANILVKTLGRLLRVEVDMALLDAVEPTL